MALVVGSITNQHPDAMANNHLEHFRVGLKSIAALKCSAHVAAACCSDTRKKNGTKSALVKILVNRIAEDPHGIVPEAVVELSSPCECPKCGEAFARPVVMRGKSALKIIGNRVRAKG